MAIKVQGDVVIDDSRVLRGITSIDAATKSSLTAAGLSGGVNISGNTNPFVNTTEQYTITNYSSFNTYSVSATRGTASINGNVITIVFGSSAGVAVLTVTVNGVAYEFNIALGAAVVATPTISVSDAPSNVSETPTLTTSAFSVIGGSDTHASTTWRIRRASDSVVVWQSVNDVVNKTSIVVPSGNLLVSTAYIAEAIHNGTSLGASGTSTASFTTRAVFFDFSPEYAGQPYGGGYYAGKFVTGGKIYALVVAPRALGGMPASPLQWKTSQTTTSGTTSVNDGLANTNAMIAAGAAAHPAANFCRNLNIAGYTDWYMPSKDELEICYRYLKPTTDTNNTSSGANSSSIPQTSNYTSGSPAQTSVAIFQTGNTEAFRTDGTTVYWSSTEFSSVNAWRQFFSNGYQSSNDVKDFQLWVRAVRRVEIPA